MIRVEVSAKLTKDGKPPSGNAVQKSIDQCVADAVEGSFDEYPKALTPMLRLRAERVGEDQVVRKDTHTAIRFSFGLPEEVFPVADGGLQLLVNLLAGDIFPTETLGCRWQDVAVLGVDLPEPVRVAANTAFRDGRARSVTEIRASFQLAHDRPLLAYSLKPRVGLSFDEVRQMTLDVLAAGFNVVELDSRNLALRTAPLSKWIDLAKEAASVGRHVTAFSPNLSVAAGQMPSIANDWVTGVNNHGPVLMKVDGGLDGMSSLQAIRSLTLPTEPIITCYPILRGQLASAIGPNTWVDLLSLCGVDIIYPGGRPTFPNERRHVWGSHVDDWSRAARIYDRFVAAGRPMPTIAGGLHPGHLHACYELLGPNVAYFLGGAVALHPDGPKAGAQLCVQVLEGSIELAREAESAGDNHAEDLNTRLLKKVESVRYPTTRLNYYSPANIFGLGDDADAPLPFYRR